MRIRAESSSRIQGIRGIRARIWLRQILACGRIWRARPLFPTLVDTALLGGGDSGLLQQGGQGDMLESRRATPRRARPLATFVRAPPGSSPPRDPSPIYLPWPGRSAICGGRRTFFPPAAFSACAPQQPQHPRARTAHPRHRELLQGDKISDWRPPYGQQDLNLSSARPV